MLFVGNLLRTFARGIGFGQFDDASAEAEAANLALNEQSGGASDVSRAKDAMATLEIMTDALGSTAKERDTELADRKSVV